MQKKIWDEKRLETKANRCLEIAYNLGMVDKKAVNYAADLMHYTDIELDRIFEDSKLNPSKFSNLTTKLFFLGLLGLFSYFLIKN